MNTSTDTIVAPATASGGAIAVIRLSGPEAIACCDRAYFAVRIMPLIPRWPKPPGTPCTTAKS